MKATRFEKFVLIGICMSFSFYAIADDVSNDDLFLWFAELSTEDAELLSNQDPDELETDLESVKELFVKAEITQVSNPEFLTTDTPIAEDHEND